MAEIIPNQFTSYSLTQDEELQGSIFSLLQTYVLQNELSICAMEKNALEFNPSDPIAFAQQEAALKGKIELLTYLLDKSVASNNILNNPHYDPNK
jgi:hypothetical protein